MKPCYVCLSLLISVGCCTAPPPRLDGKKVRAFRDEVASLGSLALLYAPVELQADVKQAVTNANLDAEAMTK